MTVISKSTSAIVGVSGERQSLIRRAWWKSRAVASFWFVVVAILVAFPFAILLAYGAPLDSHLW